MPVLSAPDTHTHELPGARFTTLASPSRGSSETSVWQVELLPGAETVPHRVTREEIFVALTGRAIATLDGAAHTLAAGETLILSPATEFTLEPSGDEPFRALVCLPVGGQAIIADGEPFTPPWAT
jgi:quercetin dioxygenase-like cupin family protein